MVFLRSNADTLQRPLFWAQVPLAFVAGLGVYNSLPRSLDSRETPKGSVGEKLARIDYLGAMLLVSSSSRLSSSLSR